MNRFYACYSTEALYFNRSADVSLSFFFFLRQAKAGPVLSLKLPTRGTDRREARDDASGDADSEVDRLVPHQLITNSLRKGFDLLRLL